MKELEKPRLPEDLAQYAGHVLYPNEESAKWDLEGLDRSLFFSFTCDNYFVLV